MSFAPAFVPPFPKRRFLLSRFSLKANRFYTTPPLGTNASEKRRSRVFPSRSADGNKLRGLQMNHCFQHYFSKGAEAPKGMQRPVAAMQPHRLPVGDNISIPPISCFMKAFVPSSQKARPTFEIFTKKQPFLHTPASWDECLGKRDVCRVFSELKR